MQATICVHQRQNPCLLSKGCTDLQLLGQVRGRSTAWRTARPAKSSASTWSTKKAMGSVAVSSIEQAVIRGSQRTACSSRPTRIGRGIIGLGPSCRRMRRRSSVVNQPGRKCTRICQNSCFLFAAMMVKQDEFGDLPWLLKVLRLQTRTLDAILSFKVVEYQKGLAYAPIILFRSEHGTPCCCLNLNIFYRAS